MSTFLGILQSTADGPATASVQLDGERLRMWSDRHRMGSWDRAEVEVRRVSIFRFEMATPDHTYSFSPDDPAGFSDAVGAEIDLTTAGKSRFGLADRIRAAEAPQP